MHVFTHSPSLNGFEATAVSLAMRELALTAASLMSLLWGNTHCCFCRPDNTSFTFSLLRFLQSVIFEDSHSGDEGSVLSALQHAVNTPNIHLSLSPPGIKRRMSMFLGTLCTLRHFSLLWQRHIGAMKVPEHIMLKVEAVINIAGKTKQLIQTGCTCLTYLFCLL